jgi:hypothetical protein
MANGTVKRLFRRQYRSITAAPDMRPSRVNLDALRGGCTAVVG